MALLLSIAIQADAETRYTTANTEYQQDWLLVDNFESSTPLNAWRLEDPDNRTKPRIERPQVTEVKLENNASNHYLLKKPAADGVIGNRKALSYRPLPYVVKVGERYTFYTRINVEYFPNNHSFGLSNLPADKIAQQNYNAFEPMIRITDKLESNGDQNDGTLMVLSGYKKYSKINNPLTGKAASPLATNTWYELWYVVDNNKLTDGGQQYTLYVRGGEFKHQQKTYDGAVFRMKREQPLTHFVTISNTGSIKSPYGNGGVRYDDIYMAAGQQLSTPPIASKQ